MCMLVNTGDGPVHKNKSLVIVPLRENGKLRPGIEIGKKIKKIGHEQQRHRLLYFDEGARAAAPPHWRRGPGLHLPDAAVPGRAPVVRRQLPSEPEQLHPVDGGGGRKTASSLARRWPTSSGCSSSWPR